MSTCQDLQEKIQQLKNLQSEFEAIYGALPPGSNRDQGKRDILDEANKKSEALNQLFEEINEIERSFYWRSLKLGNFRDKEELRQAMENQGIKISEWAEEIFKQIEISGQEQEVFLQRTTVFELTGKKSASFRDIYEAIEAVGGEPCPAEVGPQLCLQYPDLPEGKNLEVFMDPLVHSNLGPNAFYVRHSFDNQEFSLEVLYAFPESRWRGESELVYLVGKFVPKN